MQEREFAERDCAQVRFEAGVGKPKALDLFSGTGSVANVLRERGYEVVTLDLLPKYNADWQMDVMEWQYWRIPARTFDVITASPPCTEFSQAKTVGERKLTQAMYIVEKTLEIIQYFRPRFWWLETPRHGKLPRMAVMQAIPFWDADYCRFGRDFQKPTRFYGSSLLSLFEAQKCLGAAFPAITQGKHRGSLGGERNASVGKTYPIPKGLVHWLMIRVEEKLGLFPGGLGSVEDTTISAQAVVEEWAQPPTSWPG